MAGDAPSLPLAPSPTPPLNDLPLPLPQAPSEAPSRYFWKLSVVPDWSLRNTTWIGRSGSGVPALSAAIAGAFQFLIVPLKILAAIGPSRFRGMTPLPFQATAIAPSTTRRSTG